MSHINVYYWELVMCIVETGKAFSSSWTHKVIHSWRFSVSFLGNWWNKTRKSCTLILLCLIFFADYIQGSYGQGKSGNFEGVRESQGKQRGSGKSRRILKYCSLDQLFMHYFHNFCRPCKHCRLVYIAIFYNGTKFSITFVYLVLFYWCHK